MAYRSFPLLLMPPLQSGPGLTLRQTDVRMPTHPRAVPSQERPEPTFHWAVRVGGVVYELEKRGTGVIALRYLEFIEQDWSTQYRVGGTILTDDQLKHKGSSILSQMSPKYSAFPNDCQDFVLRFLEDIGHGRTDREKLSGLVSGSGYKNPLELMGRQIILTGIPFYIIANAETPSLGRPDLTPIGKQRAESCIPRVFFQLNIGLIITCAVDKDGIEGLNCPAANETALPLAKTLDINITTCGTGDGADDDCPLDKIHKFNKNSNQSILIVWDSTDMEDLIEDVDTDAFHELYWNRWHCVIHSLGNPVKFGHRVDGQRDDDESGEQAPPMSDPGRTKPET
ncbi:hypothetical protein B0H19DRAFT_1061670 [Mycena capillaripes]|nr:hypothetical protein B0H19DRAFT_1061670 [Mycena capillaripes]